jgi:8-oxo-dGTP diphosphatase
LRKYRTINEPLGPLIRPPERIVATRLNPSALSGKLPDVSPRPVQTDGRVHGVVVAIQRPADGKWLLIRRSANVPAPNKVCFPGGAIEVGEQQFDAVQRETREEVGLEVHPLHRCWRHDFPDKPLTLWGWTAKVISTNPPKADPAEVSEILWLTPEEAVTHPDAIETNKDFVACLLREKR